MSSSARKFLRLLDANLEKPFLVAGMLLMIVIITYQTVYRYSITELLGLLDSFTPDFPLVLPGKE